jgi:response regulator NasT
MTAHEMTEPQAFRWIQRAAMDNRTSMRAVAEVVLSGEREANSASADGGDAATN